mmetsp:Transcript_52439/g.169075  ORF Transcript_52439/g.169075 Transcript_52439/m.169075 type:complete len:386 (-) Transcript_52439:73-1230(-)
MAVRLPGQPLELWEEAHAGGGSASSPPQALACSNGSCPQPQEAPSRAPAAYLQEADGGAEFGRLQQEAAAPAPAAYLQEADGGAELGRLQQDLAVGDLEEDLAVCIAVWQDNARQAVSLGQPTFPALARRRATSSCSLNLDACSPRSSVEAVGPVLSVDAGGVIFRTTASTLRKAPYFQAFLGEPSSDGGTSAALMDGTNIFVDRSGELFGFILEFLRSGHWLLMDRASDPEFVSALRDEACFYGLDGFRDCAPVPRISEYATVWQFQSDTALYVDCFEQTIREDPDHQGLFRLCKYIGILPLDQQTCTKRFKATSHSLQSVMTYFAMAGFCLQHVVEGCMVTHTTSADGQHRSGYGTQYIMSRSIPFPVSWHAAAWTPLATQRS